MSLFQTSYHVNTWISISLLHIISSTSVISKKRRRIQAQETLHFTISWVLPLAQYASPHALGHLPSPCSMKSPTLSTTLNWDDPPFIASPSDHQPPDHQPSDPHPSHVSALHLPNSKVSWCHRWKPQGEVGEVQMSKSWGEPLQQLQV